MSNNLFTRRANKLLEECKSAATLQEAQQHLTALNLLLKEVSELQSEVGLIRKAAREIVGNKRKTSPVGRPAEGSMHSINGKQMVFIANRFYEVADAPAPTEGITPDEEAAK